MYFSDFPIIGAEARLPIYLISIGLNEYQYHVIRKEGYWHPQILYCTRGSGTLIFDGVSHLIKPNTAFFIPAGYPHEYYSNDEVWDTHWVVPGGYAVDELLKEFGLTSPLVLRIYDIERLERYFRKMHEELLNDSVFGNYKASGILYNFLIEFYRIMSGKSSGGKLSPSLIKAIDYINAHYAEKITMQQLCAESGVSSQHLCRLFRGILGCRPTEYIALRRIKAAKTSLSETDKSIEKIAEETGFCSSWYMCKLFKRYEDITPSEYRRGQKPLLK